MSMHSPLRPPPAHRPNLSRQTGSLRRPRGRRLSLPHFLLMVGGGMLISVIFLAVTLGMGWWPWTVIVLDRPDPDIAPVEEPSSINIESPIINTVEAAPDNIEAEIPNEAEKKCFFGGTGYPIGDNLETEGGNFVCTPDLLEGNPYWKAQTIEHVPLGRTQEEANITPTPTPTRVIEIPLPPPQVGNPCSVPEQEWEVKSLGVTLICHNGQVVRKDPPRPTLAGESCEHPGHIWDTLKGKMVCSDKGQAVLIPSVSTPTNLTIKSPETKPASAQGDVYCIIAYSSGEPMSFPEGQWRIFFVTTEKGLDQKEMAPIIAAQCDP